MRNIARLRKLIGWDQSQLARAAKLDLAEIELAEQGAAKTSLGTLRLIAHAMNVPLEVLIQNDTAEAEARLLSVFHSLPADRQKEWLGTARDVRAGA